MFSTITMNKRQLLLLCTCNVLMTFMGTITVKLMPVYTVYLGAEPSTTGLFVAFAFLSVTVGNIFGGWLSDRLGGRKLLLQASIAVWIPVAVLMIQATDMPRLIVTTGLFWLPGGIAIAMVNAITALSVGASDRGKVFGLTTVAAGIGGLLAGSVGGPIAERWGFPTLFGIMAAVVGVFLLITIFLQDQPTSSHVQQPSPQEGVPASTLAGIGYLLWLFLAAHLLVKLGELTGGLGIPLSMTQLGFDAAAVSSAIAVSAAVTLPLPFVFGWLSDRVGRKRFLIVCYGIGAMGLLLLFQAQSLWEFWLATSLLAIAEKTNGVAKAMVADLTPAHAIGRGISLLTSAHLIAGIIGLGAAGYVMQTIGISFTMLVGACLSLAAMGLLMALRQLAAGSEPLSAAEAKS